MNKLDLAFRSPLLNAAGTLGFTPAKRGPVDLDSFGAFFTNPISRGPRRPAEERACQGYPGGLLLHTGLPNPGFRAVLRQHAAQWRAASLAVVVHLIGDQPEDIAWMVRGLESGENIAGVEIGIPPGASPDLARMLVQAAAGELPVIACLPMERAPELAAALARDGGTAAFSLAAPRGCLPGSQKLLRGRMLGPGVFPLALAAVHELTRLGLPVIGGGGVQQPADFQAMRAAGALAVQLDLALWQLDGAAGFQANPRGV